MIISEEEHGQCVASMLAFVCDHDPGDAMNPTRHPVSQRRAEALGFALLLRWNYIDTDDNGSWWVTPKGFDLLRREARRVRLAAEPTGLPPHEIGDA